MVNGRRRSLTGTVIPVVICGGVPRVGVGSTIVCLLVRCIVGMLLAALRMCLPVILLS